MLCLISPAYIASKVCQEEYNLAMALNCDPNYGTVLFPILVEPVEVLPTWCRDYPPLDTSEKNISTFLSNVELLKGMWRHFVQQHPMLAVVCRYRSPTML